MAITVRIPEPLDRRLDSLAAQMHTSKHALLLQGAELIVQRSSRREQIDEAIDFVMEHDASLIERLKDA